MSGALDRSLVSARDDAARDVLKIEIGPTDANSVSIDAAPPAALIDATVPRPRAADDAVRNVALQVREWRRLGRHCLFVEAADGRTVGMFNVNNGEATLTNEDERPLFEAAIAGWFTAALDTPADVSDLTDRQVEPSPTAAPEATAPEETAAPDGPIVDEGTEPAPADAPVEPETRLIARAKARGEGRTAAVRSLFVRIMEEHVESTREQLVPAQDTEPVLAVTGARMSARAKFRASRPRPEIGNGRHRGGQEDPVAGQVPEDGTGEPGIPQQRPAGRHRAERVSKS